MISDYQRLPGLLENQRRALTAGNEQEMERTGREIKELIARIAEHSLHLGELDARDKAQLHRLIEQSQEEVHKNMAAWKASLNRIQAARENLQATRRFYTHHQNRVSDRPRFSKTG